MKSKVLLVNEISFSRNVRLMQDLVMRVLKHHFYVRYLSYKCRSIHALTMR